MFSRFIQHVHSQHLFLSKHRILLALSGGVDSVVLAHLLKKGDFDFELAHCNFMLRGTDSTRDETFCIELSKSLHVPIHTRSFDVASYSTKHKVSTQIAARNLRYDWFEDLLNKKGFDHLLTAHHANDSMETMLINLVRGTGINGLKGIPEKNGRILRPLLPFTKTEILNYAKEEKIKFRQDKSNSEIKYDRNFIRMKVIPLLKQLNPSIEQTLIGNLNRFREESHLITDYLSQQRKNLLTVSGETVRINRDGLMISETKYSLLNFLLSPYGFNSTQQSDILNNLNTNGLVGKHFHSKSYQLTIDRKDLVIRPMTSSMKSSIQIHSLGDFLSKAGIHVQRVKKVNKAGANELYVNINRLVFPLLLRSPLRGDRFRPFGMKGFKLVSDYLKGQKLNSFEKENVQLLVNGDGEIIWVIGLRSDERYKVHADETNLVKLIRE